MTENNAATQDFLSKLPMTVTFEDFHVKEKIAFPDERIDATGAPGMAAESGDFFCYAPWGNFGFFYAPLAFSTTTFGWAGPIISTASKHSMASALQSAAPTKTSSSGAHPVVAIFC